MASVKVVRAICAFEKAVSDRTSFNASESLYAVNEERIIIEHNYVKARAKLERLMENL